MLRNAPTPSPTLGSFAEVFHRLLDPATLARLWHQLGPKPRGQKLKLAGPPLVQGLVFHVVGGVGSWAAPVFQWTGVKVSASDLSQRRTAAGVGVFEAMVRAALRPLASLGEHPAAFYRGGRLVGIDGSQTSVSHTPQWLRPLSKAARRRCRAALAKVPWCGRVELGTRAPWAVALGLGQASEWKRAHRLWAQWPLGCLWLGDRLDGVGAFVNEWLVAGQTVGSQWLVRARSQVKRGVQEVLADGSTLVRVAVADRRNSHRKPGTVLVREIRGRVRRPGGAGVTVRLGTSLLDAPRYPAREW